MIEKNEFENSINNNNTNIMSFKEEIDKSEEITTDNILNSESTKKLIQLKERIEIPYFILTQAKKSCWHCLCCCCCNNNKYKLIRLIDLNELESYYDLKELINKKYNPSLNQHENSLKFLFLISLKCDLTKDLNSENWKKIGFSNSNPRKDLVNYEGGYFIILFLTHFIKQYEEIFNEILLYQGNFFLIKICLLTVFYFKLSLDMTLNKNESFNEREKYGIKSVDIKQFIGFIKNQYNDPNYAYDIISLIIISMKGKIQNLNFENDEDKIKFIEKETKISFKDIFYIELTKEFSSLSFNSNYD